MSAEEARPADEPIKMKARKPGFCGACKAEIRIDTMILFRHANQKGVNGKAGVIGCEACTSALRGAASKRPASAEGVFKRRIKGEGDAVFQVVKPYLEREEVKEDRRNPPVRHAPPAPALGPLAVAATGGPAHVVKPDTFQQGAIDWRKGEVVVAAAAGSGKTEVLVQRSNALVQYGVPASQIINLVFNKDAAESARKRLMLVSPVHAENMAKTFHAFGYELLRKYRASDPQIAARRIIGGGVSYGAVMYAAFKEASVEGEPKDFMKAATVVREAMIDLKSPRAEEQVADLLFPRTWSLASAAGDPAIPKLEERRLDAANDILRFCIAYEAQKVQENAIDFADMLAGAAWLLRRDPAVADAVGRMFQHVQVDEGQDMNPARLEIALACSQRAQSIMFVGDGRQSINAFTGARPDLFLGRTKREGVTLLTLPVNRRSTANIVALSNMLVRDRPYHLGGDSTALPENGIGPVPVLWITADEFDEATTIAHTVKDWLSAGDPLVDARGRNRVACLVRTNAQAAALEVELTAMGIPVSVSGTKGGVWSTFAGEDFLAYLRLAEGAIGSREELMSCLYTAMNKPARYLARAHIDGLAQRAAGSGQSYIDVLMGGNTAAQAFARDLAAITGETDWTKRCAMIVDLLTRELRAQAEWNAGSIAEAAAGDDDRLQMYEGLGRAATRIGSYEQLAARAGKVAATGRIGVVEIATLHAAKGREWDAVFVCGINKRKLPLHRATTDEQIEEELRLLYVGLTRARRVLVCSSGGHPSVFWPKLQKGVESLKEVKHAPSER